MKKGGAAAAGPRRSSQPAAQPASSFSRIPSFSSLTLCGGLADLRDASGWDAQRGVPAPVLGTAWAPFQERSCSPSPSPPPAATSQPKAGAAPYPLFMTVAAVLSTPPAASADTSAATAAAELLSGATPGNGTDSSARYSSAPHGAGLAAIRPLSLEELASDPDARQLVGKALQERQQLERRCCSGGRRCSGSHTVAARLPPLDAPASQAAPALAPARSPPMLVSQQGWDAAALCLLAWLLAQQLPAKALCTALGRLSATLALEGSGCQANARHACAPAAAQAGLLPRLVSKEAVN